MGLQNPTRFFEHNPNENDKECNFVINFVLIDWLIRIESVLCYCRIWYYLNPVVRKTLGIVSTLPGLPTLLEVLKQSKWLC